MGGPDEQHRPARRRARRRADAHGLEHHRRHHQPLRRHRHRRRALSPRTPRAGQGEYIDVALLDSTVAGDVALRDVLPDLGHGAAAARQRRQRRRAVAGVPCRDGAIMLTVGNDAQFVRFCRAIEHPELLDDKRFATGVERIRHRDALIPILERIFRRG
jgi:crotonobetainyl-CoA:carnitine CoA-transferase CaiB-like acyl-CoA transferase